VERESGASTHGAARRGAGVFAPRGVVLEIALRPKTVTQPYHVTLASVGDQQNRRDVETDVSAYDTACTHCVLVDRMRTTAVFKL